MINTKSDDIGSLIKKYEPLIFKVIHNNILRYWARGHGTNNIMMHRFGMTLDDLMQIGRKWTYEQILWYNKNGDRSRAGLFTLLYQHLNNKFINLSRKYTHGKYGGPVIDNEFIKIDIQNYLNHYDHSKTVEDNQASLLHIMPYNPGWKKQIVKQDSNVKLFNYAQKILLNLTSQKTIDFCEADDYLCCHEDWNPESCLMAKEEIERRYKIKEDIMKKQLKVYYFSDPADDDMVEVANVTYCCNKAKHHLLDVTNFLFFDDRIIPSLAIEDKKTGAQVEIYHCPFCGGEITVKPSRL